MQDSPLVAASPNLDQMMSLFQQALARGRLSSNVEDTRRTRWNAPALAAIDHANGVAPREAAGFLPDEYGAPQPAAPRSEPTPANNGVDDLFTRTPTYHTAPVEDWRDREAMWRNLDARTKARNAATQTPGAKANMYDPATRSFIGDGSTGPQPSSGMSTVTVPQTMTPNPTPEPVDPTVFMQHDGGMQQMPESANTPAPDLAGILKSLFSF